jgi:hypothetical protein
MHIELRKCAPRPSSCRPVWFYAYGFGLWLGRWLFTFGHDTRSRTVGLRDV